MKILISAYACEPGAGSEYGVGWMVPTTMARRYPDCSVYVLTRSRCRAKIEEALKQLNLPNLCFLFYDIPHWLTYKKEMQSRWGEQINYLWWQWLVRGFVRKQQKVHGFDVIHHLTFNQYRTPSPGFFLDIPFVMGPIGGAELVNPVFWPDLGTHTLRKERLRQNGKDLKVLGWMCRWKQNRKLILCSCQENKERMSKYVNPAVLQVMPAIGYSTDDFSPVQSEQTGGTFEMLYAGKAWDWKGIHIYLKAVRRAFLDRGVTNFRVLLVGIRFEEEQIRVTNWVKELNLTEQVTLIPFVNRSELLKMEANSHLAVYPAFRDSGSMSVLEACALGCPSICFDAGGQDVFPDDVVLKVPVGPTYEETLRHFAEKLRWAYEHPDETKRMGQSARNWVADHLTWDSKVDDFMKIYQTLIG